MQDTLLQEACSRYPGGRPNTMWRAVIRLAPVARGHVWGRSVRINKVDYSQSGALPTAPAGGGRGAPNK